MYFLKLTVIDYFCVPTNQPTDRPTTKCAVLCWTLYLLWYLQFHQNKTTLTMLRCLPNVTSCHVTLERNFGRKWVSIIPSTYVQNCTVLLVRLKNLKHSKSELTFCTSNLKLIFIFSQICESRNDNWFTKNVIKICLFKNLKSQCLNRVMR